MKGNCTNWSPKSLSLALLFVISGIASNAQIISTVTGSTPGYFGDGGPASSAQLNLPHNVFVDLSGNVYISDWGNCVIRKISGGIISTIAGTGVPGYSGDGGPATSAQLYHPDGLYADAIGNVYFGDASNNRVRKINTSGIITTIAGTGIPTYGGDGGPATSAGLYIPDGIAFDNLGNLYIADRSNNRIRKVTTSGIISTIAGTGVAGYSGDGGAATDAQLYQPNYVLVDTSGNVFVSDNGNQRIRVINTSGIITTFAGNGIGTFGGDGGPATDAQIYFPAGMAKDNSGNLYISDYSNNRIRKVNTAGIISTVCGTGIGSFSGDGGSPLLADLNLPINICFNASGDLYIADCGNSRIRLVSEGNHPPVFAEGKTQSLIVCVSEASLGFPINTNLAVLDTDLGQTETWSLISPPSHGVALVDYSTVSTGSLLTPTGLTYTPTGGYIGADMFKVRISDGIRSDTTTINVIVSPYPNAGIISGIDSICPGQASALVETASGGIWSNANSSITTVNGSGVVTGITPGLDTIVYTVINPCGIVSAIFPFYVRSYTTCHTGTNELALNTNNGINIYPNPNTGTFSIELSSTATDNAKFIITNLTGKKIMEFNSMTNKKEDLMLNVPSGIYFISAFTGNEIYYGKLSIIK